MSTATPADPRPVGDAAGGRRSSRGANYMYLLAPVQCLMRLRLLVRHQRRVIVLAPTACGLTKQNR